MEKKEEAALERALRELRALRRDVAKMRGLIRPQEQRAFTYAQAGALLGKISKSTVQRMVKRHQLLTCPIGGVPMIPLSEIVRLSQPSKPSKRGHRQRKTAAPYSAKEEAAAARVALKRR